MLQILKRNKGRTDYVVSRHSQDLYTHIKEVPRIYYYKASHTSKTNRTDAGEHFKVALIAEVKD